MKDTKVTKEEADKFKKFGVERKTLRTCLTDLAEEEQDFWKRVMSRYNLPKDMLYTLNYPTRIIKVLGGKKGET